jgi:hypothetical protein
MPSLYVYAGAMLYLLFAGWCMSGPKNPQSDAE